MSLFAAAEAQSHAELIAEFGEAWEHVPTLRPNRGQATPDPARQPYQIQGVFDDDGALLRLGLEETGVITRRPVLSLRKCDVVIPILTGHWFKRCRTGEMYEVTDVQPDSLSGVGVYLTQMGLPL